MDAVVAVRMSSVHPLATVWVQLSSGVRAGLVARGLDTALVFHAALDGSVEDTSDLVRDCGGTDEDVPLLLQLWEMAERPAGRGLRSIAHTPVVARAVSQTLAARKREFAEACAHTDATATDQPLHSCHASLPVSLKRSRALEGDPQARQKAEDARRQHWILQLRELVHASKLPVVELAAASSSPTAVLAVIGQGKRASTLRRRILDWRKAARFFMLTFNMVWPRGVHDVVDYLATLAASGVGRSAIGRAVQALNFMEKAGGLPEPRWLSQHPLVKATHNELLVTMASGATRATRKAPQMPCLLMMKFEGFVVDDSLQLYWRLFAWYRLLRVWACLRFDDHRGLLPSSLRLVAGSLRGTLVRSKTTGAGKRREELYLHVDRMAYILESSWLEVGWRLWQRCGTARDYFLLLPTADFTGVIELEASYTDSQACSRALMRKVLLQSGEPLVTIPVGLSFGQSMAIALHYQALRLSSMRFLLTGLICLAIGHQSPQWATCAPCCVVWGTFKRLLHIISGRDFSRLTPWVKMTFMLSGLHSCAHEGCRKLRLFSKPRSWQKRLHQHLRA